MNQIVLLWTFLLFSIPVFGFGDYILCWFNCFCSTVRKTADEKAAKEYIEKKLADVIKKQTNKEKTEDRIIIEKKEEAKN
jgi:hypothetical protein